MNFGLSEEQLKLLTEIVINPLKNKGAQVFVFGSRARGNQHPFSDIDIFFVEASMPFRVQKLVKLKKQQKKQNWQSL